MLIRLLCFCVTINIGSHYVLGEDLQKPHFQVDHEAGKLDIEASKDSADVKFTNDNLDILLKPGETKRPVVAPKDAIHHDESESRDELPVGGSKDPRFNYVSPTSSNSTGTTLDGSNDKDVGHNSKTSRFNYVSPPSSNDTGSTLDGGIDRRNSSKTSDGDSDKISYKDIQNIVRITESIDHVSKNTTSAKYEGSEKEIENQMNKNITWKGRINETADAMNSDVLDTLNELKDLVAVSLHTQSSPNDASAADHTPRFHEKSGRSKGDNFNSTKGSKSKDPTNDNIKKMKKQEGSDGAKTDKHKLKEKSGQSKDDNLNTANVIIKKIEKQEDPAGGGVNNEFKEKHPDDMFYVVKAQDILNKYKDENKPEESKIHSENRPLRKDNNKTNLHDDSDISKESAYLYNDTIKKAERENKTDMNANEDSYISSKEEKIQDEITPAVKNSPLSENAKNTSKNDTENSPKSKNKINDKKTASEKQSLATGDLENKGDSVVSTSLDKNTKNSVENETASSHNGITETKSDASRYQISKFIGETFGFEPAATDGNESNNVGENTLAAKSTNDEEQQISEKSKQIEKHIEALSEKNKKDHTLTENDESKAHNSQSLDNNETSDRKDEASSSEHKTESSMLSSEKNNEEQSTNQNKHTDEINKEVANEDKSTKETNAKLSNQSNELDKENNKDSSTFSFHGNEANKKVKNLSEKELENENRETASPRNTTTTTTTKVDNKVHSEAHEDEISDNKKEVSQFTANKDLEDKNNNKTPLTTGEKTSVESKEDAAEKAYASLDVDLEAISNVSRQLYNEYDNKNTDEKHDVDAKEEKVYASIDNDLTKTASQMEEQTPSNYTAIKDKNTDPKVDYNNSTKNETTDHWKKYIYQDDDNDKDAANKLTKTDNHRKRKIIAWVPAQLKHNEKVRNKISEHKNKNIVLKTFLGKYINRKKKFRKIKEPASEAFASHKKEVSDPENKETIAKDKENKLNLEAEHRYITQHGSKNSSSLGNKVSNAKTKETDEKEKEEEFKIEAKIENMETAESNGNTEEALNDAKQLAEDVAKELQETEKQLKLKKNSNNSNNKKVNSNIISNNNNDNNNNNNSQISSSIINISNNNQKGTVKSAVNKHHSRKQLKAKASKRSKSKKKNPNVAAKNKIQRRKNNKRSNKHIKAIRVPLQENAENHTNTESHDNTESHKNAESILKLLDMHGEGISDENKTPHQQHHHVFHHSDTAVARTKKYAQKKQDISHKTPENGDVKKAMAELEILIQEKSEELKRSTVPLIDNTTKNEQRRDEISHPRRRVLEGNPSISEDERRWFYKDAKETEDDYYTNSRPISTDHQISQQRKYRILDPTESKRAELSKTVELANKSHSVKYDGEKNSLNTTADLHALEKRLMKRFVDTLASKRDEFFRAADLANNSHPGGKERNKRNEQHNIKNNVHTIEKQLLKKFVDTLASKRAELANKPPLSPKDAEKRNAGISADLHALEKALMEKFIKTNALLAKKFQVKAKERELVAVGDPFVPINTTTSGKERTLTPLRYTFATNTTMVKRNGNEVDSILLDKYTKVNKVLTKKLRNLTSLESPSMGVRQNTATFDPDNINNRGEVASNSTMEQRLLKTVNEVYDKDKKYAEQSLKSFSDEAEYNDVEEDEQNELKNAATALNDMINITGTTTTESNAKTMATNEETIAKQEAENNQAVQTKNSEKTQKKSMKSDQETNLKNSNHTTSGKINMSPSNSLQTSSKTENAAVDNSSKNTATMDTKLSSDSKPKVHNSDDATDDNESIFTSSINETGDDKWVPPVDGDDDDTLFEKDERSQSETKAKKEHRTNTFANETNNDNLHKNAKMENDNASSSTELTTQDNKDKYGSMETKAESESIHLQENYVSGKQNDIQSKTKTDESNEDTKAAKMEDKEKLESKTKDVVNEETNQQKPASNPESDDAKHSEEANEKETKESESNKNSTEGEPQHENQENNNKASESKANFGFSKVKNKTFQNALLISSNSSTDLTNKNVSDNEINKKNPSKSDSAAESSEAEQLHSPTTTEAKPESPENDNDRVPESSKISEDDNKLQTSSNIDKNGIENEAQHFRDAVTKLEETIENKIESKNQEVVDKKNKTIESQESATTASTEKESTDEKAETSNSKSENKENSSIKSNDEPKNSKEEGPAKDQPGNEQHENSLINLSSSDDSKATENATKETKENNSSIETNKTDASKHEKDEKGLINALVSDETGKTNNNERTTNETDTIKNDELAGDKTSNSKETKELLDDPSDDSPKEDDQQQTSQETSEAETTHETSQDETDADVKTTDNENINKEENKSNEKASTNRQTATNGESENKENAIKSEGLTPKSSNNDTAQEKVETNEKASTNGQTATNGESENKENAIKSEGLTAKSSNNDTTAQEEVETKDTENTSKDKDTTTGKNSSENSKQKPAQGETDSNVTTKDNENTLAYAEKTSEKEQNTNSKQTETLKDGKNDSNNKSSDNKNEIENEKSDPYSTFKRSKINRYFQRINR